MSDRPKQWRGEDRWRADPFSGGRTPDLIPFEGEPDLIDFVHKGQPRSPWGTRNGLPVGTHYTYCPGEAAREAEVAERVAAAKALALAGWEAEQAAGGKS